MESKNQFQQFAVVQMTEQRLREHLQHAAQLGAHLALLNAGLPVKDLYTRTELSGRHGAGTVNSLIKKGLLTPHRYPNNQENGHIVYSEKELLSNLI